jgi:hypothetical protein
VEVQNVDNMEKHKMLISVTFETDSETKGELIDDENRIIDYLEELIDSDYHDRFEKIKLKRIRL